MQNNLQTTTEVKGNGPRRQYFIKWRFVIEDKKNTDIRKKDALFRFYMPRWSDFMKEINDNHRLSREQQRELPFLRNCIPSTISTSDVINLLNDKNTRLSRLLIEAAPIFDVVPHDLKVYIISAFGVKSDEYLFYDHHE